MFGSGREAIYRRQQELSVLCKKSSFSKHEIKLLYWGWKVACPDGILDERTFKEIYSQFFPQAGKPNLFFTYLFSAFLILPLLLVLQEIHHFMPISFFMQCSVTQ